jgi:hypothetical protein
MAENCRAPDGQFVMYDAVFDHFGYREDRSAEGRSGERVHDVIREARRMKESQ